MQIKKHTSSRSILESISNICPASIRRSLPQISLVQTKTMKVALIPNPIIVVIRFISEPNMSPLTLPPPPLSSVPIPNKNKEVCQKGKAKKGQTTKNPDQDSPANDKPSRPLLSESQQLKQTSDKEHSKMQSRVK